MFPVVTHGYVMSLSLEHIVRKPQADAAAPPLLILLHGLGSNEQDLFSFAPQLDPKYLIVSLRAPILSGYGGYAWFNLDFSRGMPQVDLQQFESSRKLLLQEIEEITNIYHADKNKVYLAGFSQGAMMCYAVALTHPQMIAGVVAMSGYILQDLAPKITNKKGLENLHILATHGVYDQVLPVFLGRAARDFLKTLPVKFSYQEYNMAHEVSYDCFVDIKRWLSAQIS
jgi:phospholipase/carboxylesterase